MISNKEIDLEKAFYENLRKKLKGKQRSYPEGSICFRYEHGKHRAYRNQNGKLKYIGRDNGKLAVKLLDKKINEKIIKYLDRNLEMLSRLQTSWEKKRFTKLPAILQFVPEQSWSLQHFSK